MPLFNNIFKSSNKKLLKELSQEPFRKLSLKESFHTSINDFREFPLLEEQDIAANLNNKEEKKLLSYPNNKIIITCEHATNNFHSYETKLSKSDKEYLETHWAYDIGAKDTALSLAEKTESLAISTNFSRLIIDPNRNILSNTLIRKFVEVDVELDINKDDDREKRIELYYLPYYNLLYEVLNTLNPNYFISIHSFTPYYEKEKKRDFHVGLLFKEDNPLNKSIYKHFKKNEVSFRINEPYDMNSGFMFNYDAICNYNFPELCEGVMIEVRNDMAENNDYREFITDVLSDAIKDVCGDITQKSNNSNNNRI